LNQDEMLAFADILRALKQHVLEQMSETGPTRMLVTRANVISDTNGIGGRAVIFSEQYTETILQAEFFEVDCVAFIQLSRWRNPLTVRLVARGSFGLTAERFRLRRIDLARVQINADREKRKNGDAGH
jgi:hypothetical protein